MDAAEDPTRHQHQDRMIQRIVDINEGRIDGQTKRQASYLLADAYCVGSLAHRIHQAAPPLTTHSDPLFRHDELNAVHTWAQNIHALDFDDSHNESMMHCAGPVIGPVLALASSMNASAGRLILATAAGYEAALTPFRLGLAVPRGTLPTIGYGALGTTVSILVLQSATEEQIRTGLSLVAGSLGGPHSRQVMADAPEQKAYQLALSISSGLTAAGLALADAELRTEWLTGRYGLVPSPGPDESNLRRPVVGEVSVKLYPSVRYSHGPLMVAERIRSEVNATEIGIIEICTPRTDAQGRRIYEHSGRPRASTDLTWSSYSIPWLVAVMLIEGPESVIRREVTGERAEAVAQLASRTSVVDEGEGTDDGLTPVSIRIFDGTGKLILEHTLTDLIDGVDELASSEAWHRKVGYCVKDDYSVAAGRTWLETFVGALERNDQQSAIEVLPL